MLLNRVFDEIDSSYEKYLNVWADVCRIESPTNCKEGVDECGRYFAEYARELGFIVEYHRENISGDVLAITMNPNAKGKPIVFSAHLDTVHPLGSLEENPVRIEDDKIYGPGVNDCKGGAVGAIMAMDALSKCSYKDRPILLILQSDEEISSITSEKRTIDFMAKKSHGCEVFLNCEPYADRKIVIERKGIIRFVFDITGMAYHSSKCYDAANAIAEAAYKIIELEKWKDPDGITCNCGVINGGTTPNTVAENCVFYADIRYKTANELEAVKARVQEIADTVYVKGTSCKLSIKSSRVALEKTDESLKMAQRICEICKDSGLGERVPGHALGGADSADMSARGILALDSFGVKGGYSHTSKEYAFTESLRESAKIMAAVAIKL